MSYDRSINTALSFLAFFNLNSFIQLCHFMIAQTITNTCKIYNFKQYHPISFVLKKSTDSNDDIIILMF